MEPKSEQYWQMETDMLKAQSEVFFEALKLVDATQNDAPSDISALRSAVTRFRTAGVKIANVQDGGFISEAAVEGRKLFRELTEKYSRPILMWLNSEMRKHEPELWWMRFQ